MEKRPMSAQDLPAKVAITVSEMADLCRISRSRFYELMKAGVFPKPVQHPSSMRPLYDVNLIAKCLEIRATGQGLTGPVLFNRKSKKVGQPKPKAERPAKSPSVDPASETLVDAIKALGLTTSPQAVSEAVATLYPSGITGVEQGDVIRKTFLHLQGKRS
jgi:hypothetical protein